MKEVIEQILKKEGHTDPSSGAENILQQFGVKLGDRGVAEIDEKEWWRHKEAAGEFNRAIGSAMNNLQRKYGGGFRGSPATKQAISDAKTFLSQAVRTIQTGREPNREILNAIASMMRVPLFVDDYKLKSKPTDKSYAWVLRALEMNSFISSAGSRFGNFTKKLGTSGR